MRIVLISDTHSKHNEIHIPECDVLVHAGDMCNVGTIREAQSCLDWLNIQPAEFIVAIAGNHDWSLQESKELLGFGKVVYLEDSAVMLNGIKFYGSPWTPWFYDWAFNASRGPEIKKHWDKIPEDTNVLITHGPAFGILDKVNPGGSPGLEETEENRGHAGCKDLLTRIKEVNPRVHISGHLHQGRGLKLTPQTNFYNATVVDEKYRVCYDPYVIEI